MGGILIFQRVFLRPPTHDDIVELREGKLALLALLQPLVLAKRLYDKYESLSKTNYKAIVNYFINFPLITL